MWNLAIPPRPHDPQSPRWASALSAEAREPSSADPAGTVAASIRYRCPPELSGSIPPASPASTSTNSSDLQAIATASIAAPIAVIATTKTRATDLFELERQIVEWRAMQCRKILDLYQYHLEKNHEHRLA